MFTEPLKMPKGTKILSTAWYDNSAANKSNPDPKIDVKWGDQTWEEMQFTGDHFSTDNAGGQQSASGGAKPMRRRDRSTTDTRIVAAMALSAVQPRR